MVIIPNWKDRGEVEQGAFSANELGLGTNFIFVDTGPFPPDAGRVISLSPQAGTIVPRGTVVTVSVVDMTTIDFGGCVPG